MYIKITACALRENKKERIHVPSDLDRVQALSVAIYAAHPVIWDRIMTLMDNKDLRIN